MSKPTSNTVSPQQPVSKSGRAERPDLPDPLGGQYAQSPARVSAWGAPVAQSCLATVPTTNALLGVMPRLNAAKDPVVVVPTLSRDHRQLVVPSSRRRNRLRGEKARNFAADRYFHGVECLSAIQDSVGSRRGDGNMVDRITNMYNHIASHSGVESALAFLKETSGKARSTYILNGGSDAHAQLSFLGRSLPVGTRESREAAMETHKVDLSTAHQTDKRILVGAKEYARKWALRKLSQVHYMPATDIPTQSSCSERTATAGGLRSFVLELGVHPDAAELCSSLTGPIQDKLSVMNDVSRTAHARDLIRKGLPPSEVVALSERGLKTRVITKSSAGLHLAGHIVRKRLLGGLRRTRESLSTLIGFKDSDVLDGLKGACAECVVSTDLTRASDLLPLDLVSAIVEGIILSGKLTVVEADCLRLMTGPQEISYADGHRFTSSRGILMGLPTTWAVLSLCHMFWWNYSIRAVAQRRRIHLKRAFEANRFMICGDDALFAGWDEVQEEYLKTMTACGGLPSKGKHFISDGKRKRGVFLERLYEFETEKGTNTLLGCSRNGAIPVRGLVRPEIDKDWFQGNSAKLSLSESMKLLFAVDSLQSQHPGGIINLRRWAQRRIGLYRFAESLGLKEHGISISDGGSGLPTISSAGPSRAAKQLRYQVRVAAQAGDRIPSLVRGLIDPAWQLAAADVEGSIASFQQSGETMILTTPISGVASDPNQLVGVQQGGIPYINVGSFEAWQTAATVSMYEQYLLMGLGGMRKPKLSEKSLKRSLARFRKKLTPLPKGVDLENPPPSKPEQLIWIRRTVCPDTGVLLFPRWDQHDRASEARHRARLCTVAWEKV